MLFGDPAMPRPHPNLIRFRLGAVDGVTMTVQAKQPGPELIAQPIDLSVDFGASLGKRREAYERLLGDAIVGGLPAVRPRGRGRVHVAGRAARPG